MSDSDQKRAEYEARQAAREASEAYRTSVEDVTAMAARVDAMGEVQFLVDGLWPEDAYGVFAATDKAGKTWMAVDLAVSVALGDSWLGAFACQQGKVIMFSGEGGARNLIRRVRAVTEAKARPFALLKGNLFVAEAAPNVGDAEGMRQFEREVLDYGPKLVIIDPLYLAAVGAKGSDLYAMGKILSPMQLVCQDYGAALVVTHHWNKTGTGTGVQRMTGVGPTAWGRVLGSGDVSSIQTDLATGRSHAVLEWEFQGSEIPGTTFTVERDVWADDQHDLASPLHYESSVTTGFSQMIAQAQAQAVRDAAEDKRVLDWLRANPNSTGRQVEAGVGIMGIRRLKDMEKRNLVTWVSGPRRAHLWSAV
jgi:AAA domain